MRSYRESFTDKLGGYSIIVLMIFIGLLMAKAVPYSLPLYGAMLWAAWYKLECVINGGMGTIFEHAKHDFKNNFGLKQQEHRLYLSNGDPEWASLFPGKIHCIWTHILLPLTPLLVWLATELK